MKFKPELLLVLMPLVLSACSDDEVNEILDKKDEIIAEIGDKTDELEDKVDELEDEADDLKDDLEDKVDEIIGDDGDSCTTNTKLTIDSATDDGTHNSGQGPENTIDLNTSDESRWSSAGVGKEIVFDLGSLQTVAALQMKWLKGDSRQSYFDIQTSVDKSTWDMALTAQESSGTVDGFEFVNLSESEEIQYIKLIGQGNSELGENWNSLVEIEAYKCELTAAIGNEVVDAGDDDSGDNSGDSSDDVDEVIDDNSDVDQSGDLVLNGTVHNTTPDDLADVLKIAVGGDEIIVTGSGEISLKEYDFASPVLIRAATVGGTSLESVALTNSNNLVFSGFVFGPHNEASTLFKIVNSTNIKVLRNVFDHLDVTEGQSSLVMTQASKFIEIAYNVFRDKNVTHREGGKNTGSFIKYQYESDDGLMTSDTHVHHNYFKNIPAYVDATTGSVAGDSDREAIVMGIADSQDKVTNNIVEYNLFEDCDGENEIITVKTSGNIFRYNTFVNSMGSLSFRLGHDNEAYNNQFYGSGASTEVTDPNYQTGGIRVYGDGHKVHDNYMEGLTGETWRLPLLLDNGDTTDSTGNDSHQTPTNVSVYNNTIVNSKGGVHVGRASNTKYGKSPVSNTITDNVVFSSEAGTLFENDANSSTNTWSGNKVYATGSATASSGGALTSSELEVLSSEPTITKPTPLTVNDVGPLASE